MGNFNADTAIKFESSVATVARPPGYCLYVKTTNTMTKQLSQHRIASTEDHQRCNCAAMLKYCARLIIVQRSINGLQEN